MSAALINLGYLGASALFVVGLKGLAHPRTAARGNLLGSLGMAVAVTLTLLDRRILGFQMIMAALFIRSGHRRDAGPEDSDDRHAATGGSPEWIRRRRLSPRGWGRLAGAPGCGRSGA
jgi:hypothetical protein